MKIKLNKEQVDYVNGLEDESVKKDFLLNCFVSQCESQLSEEENLLKFDLPKDYVKTSDISFKNGEFVTSDRDLAFALLHFPHLCKPKDSSREKFDKFIEDNGLKKFTPPEAKQKDNEDTIKFFLKKNGHVLLGWNADGTNEIPKGEINLDAFPAMDKFFEEVEKGAKFYDVKLFHELLEYQPPHPDKVKKYTKEDLEKTFDASRADIMGIDVFNNFEEYFRAIE